MMMMMAIRVFFLAGVALGVGLDCPSLAPAGEGDRASIDDIIFKAEALCEATCGACAGSSGGFLTCAASTDAFDEYRCAEPDAASLLSMAIVTTPTVELDCASATDVAFDGEACAAFCGACHKVCVKGACAAGPMIAVDPADRTHQFRAPEPHARTITFGAVRPAA